MSGSATDDGERLDFDRLLDDFTSAVRRGESTDIDDWAARYPQHAESIRELFPTVLTLERARSEGTRPAQPFGIGVVERLGDYRILREIGRGGMGVVYEAEQESLGRRVAVKVLPPMRDDKRVRRFEREARTAAGLHHTNIVPIFGVGEQDGWHYYVMQVIAGVGLDVVLRRLREERGSPAGTTPRDVVCALLDLPAEGEPRSGGQSAYWRSIAEIGRQAAEALAYAHSKGVLHRDVKPGNLLLDRQGVVWVTDFGLAKAVGHAGITLSGDLVGTLQYMAPEQLHGRADARTDLYGLGLTLYELLTLRPAFSDADRGGLIQKIEHGRATPLRAIVPELPRDLETIVLGAIEPDPRHRYPDARALAEDLQRFLDDLPIRARRTTAVEQVWRWGRRNRAIAALAAIAVFATVAAAISGWSSYVETRRLLVESTAETDRANRTLEAALAFIQDVFDRTSRADRIEIYVDDSGDEADFEWYSPANVSADDVALLERALDFYSVFAEINAGVEDLTPRIAKACTQMGDLLWQMRRIDEAAAAYQRARELYTHLDGGSGEHRITLASLRNDTGRVMMEAADPDEAIAAFTAALELLGDDRSKVGRFERARSHLLLGIASFDRRWRSEGRGQGERRGRGRAGYFDVYRHFLTAYELNRALVAEDPTNPTFRLAAARSGRHLALATPPPRAVAGGSVAPGSIANLPIVEETLDELRALADADDAPAAYRAELAWTCVEFATRLPRRGRFGGRDDTPTSDPVVKAWIAEALALAEGLYRERPDAADHVRLLADALAEATRLDADTDLAIAEQRIRRALDLRAVATPSAREMSRGIEDRLALADILLRAGRGDEAVDRALEAVATAEARLAREPAVRAFAAELLAALWNSATIARDAGDHATAVDCLRRLQAAHPPNVSPSLDLRIALATALLSSGDVDAAVDETEALLSAAGERGARSRFGPRNRLRDRAATELCAGLRECGHGELADALEGRLRSEGRR